MNVIQITATSGADGCLQLNIPTGTAGGQFDVAVVLNAATPAAVETSTRSSEWLRTCGAIDDDTFDAHRPTDLPQAMVLG